MKSNLSVLLFSGLCLLTSCNQSAKPKVQEEQVIAQTQQVPDRPYAQFEIAPRLDLGVFEGDHLKQSKDIMFTNTGTDTLRVISAVPECDCTEVLYMDSIVAPHSNGRMTISLDLSSYPQDTIYKDIGIVTNSYKDHASTFTIFGVRK